MRTPTSDAATSHTRGLFFMVQAVGLDLAEYRTRHAVSRAKDMVAKGALGWDLHLCWAEIDLAILRGLR